MTEQEHLLELLTQECSEVVQAISKARLFGMDNVYKGESNKEHLQQELGDVIALVMIITKRHPEICSEEILSDAVGRKVLKLKKYVPSLADFELDEGDESGV